MFNEDEDWNDEQDARVLSKTLFTNPQKKTNSTGIKPKVVGKKSLLRTLETLGAVPEWKRDSHQQSSDSEEEASPSHSKKKKRRRKRGKHAEQQENRDLDQSVKDEKPVTKKMKKETKCETPRINSTPAGDTTKSTNTEVNETKTTKKLSRQQWKNKMKNKKNCKNKYRQNKPEEVDHKIESIDKQGTKEEFRTDSCNISEKSPQTSGQKKKNERILHKKEFTKEDTDSQMHMLREEKHRTNKEITTKSGQVEEGETVTKSLANGSKQKAEKAEVKVTDQQQEARRLKPELSKEQIRKRERLRKIIHNQKPDRQQSPVEPEDKPAAPKEEETRDRSASLRSRMEQQLESARFRYINEVLYSTSSGEARRMFKQDPEAFRIYHKGYTAQVQKWPTNPVDAIISYIHQKSSSLVVADFGCGDCKIARSVKNKVHCFDLAATCELVTVCDMANVPLDDDSVDIAVFCLSLMGTNLADFISEANRVLKMGGVLKISEVASRFENVRSFITALAKLGFKMVSKDTENTHFYSFGFVKTGHSPENVNKSGLHLKPCVYKKR